MFKTAIRWTLLKVLCLSMRISKRKSKNAGEFKNRVIYKKVSLLNSLLYWETIVTDAWFLKLTVGNNNNIKTSTSIKCQKFADLMPPLFLIRSETLWWPTFFLIQWAASVTCMSLKMELFYIVRNTTTGKIYPHY